LSSPVMPNWQPYRRNAAVGFHLTVGGRRVYDLEAPRWNFEPAMLGDALDYGADQAKQEALAALMTMGGCAGPYDDTTIHVEMTPAYGHVPIGDADLPHVVDCVNALGNVRGLDLGETAITDAAIGHLARLQT